MTGKFLNKHVFITGGGSWIGKAIAMLFAAEGANVFITGRNAETLQKTCLEIDKCGGKSAYFASDVKDSQSAQLALDAAMRTFGNVHILIPNAAVYPNTQLAKLSLDEWNDVITTNLTGAFLSLQLAIPMLTAQKFGRVIFISSVAGEPRGMRGYSHYCASKAGVNGLMRAAAIELGEFHITVNCISPGNICNTKRFNIDAEKKEKMMKQIPVGRIGTPEDIAHTVLFLASDEASFITGQTFIVDGGESINIQAD